MKGILEYRNKTKEITFNDIPTLYAVMENLEDKPEWLEKKRLIITREVNVILSKDEVFNPINNQGKHNTYDRKAIFINMEYKDILDFQGLPLHRFNGYDVIMKGVGETHN